MISTSGLHSPSIVKPNIPYSSKRVKEFNQRQNYNRLHKKNPATQQNLIDRKITPINSSNKPIESLEKG